MSLTPEQQAFLAELKINRPELIQQVKAEFDEERKEVIMNEKQQIEAVKQMARRAAGIPTAPSEEFEEKVACEVMEDINGHVREKLDIPTESFKTLDDDDTERDMMKAVAAHVRALVELNLGFKRPDKKPENDEEAVAKRTKKMAGII